MIGQFRGRIDIGYGGIRNVADDGCDWAGWWCCADAGHAGDAQRVEPAQREPLGRGRRAWVFEDPEDVSARQVEPTRRVSHFCRRFGQ